MKRGQVSVFIIVSVVFIAIVGIAIVLSKTNLSGISSANIPQEVAPIYEATQTCVEQRAIDAVNIVGLQGGYIQPPENSVHTEFSTIAYGLKNGKNIVPAQEKIEEEIENFLVSTIPFCLNDRVFPEFDIVSNEINAKVTIKENQIEFTVTAPLSIRKGEKIIQLNNPHKTVVPVPLGKIHARANEIIEKHRVDPTYIDLTFLSQGEFKVLFIPIDEKTLVYSITDTSQLNEDQYSFIFAVENDE